MPRSRWPALAVLLLLAALSLFLTACQQDSLLEHPDDGVDHEQVQAAARAWAATELRPRAAGAPLATATARLRPNDWGIAPNLEWQLGFRTDRPSRGRPVARAVRRACAFPEGAALTDRRVVAHLVSGGSDELVPTALRTDCEVGLDEVGGWLDHLVAHPLPVEVRGTQVSPSSVRAFVETEDAVPSVVRRVARHYCAYPRHRGFGMSLWSSSRPAAVDDPNVPSERVRAIRCKGRRA